MAARLRSEIRKIDRVEVAGIGLLAGFFIVQLASAMGFLPSGAQWPVLILALGLAYLLGVRHGRRAPRPSPLA